MGRGFTSRFALTIGGHSAAFCNTIKGGDVKQELQKVDLSCDNIQQKVVHGTTVTPFETEMAFGMSQPMIDWIYDTIKKKHSRQEGQVVIADSDSCGVVSKQFYNALIAEFSLPALTGEGKQMAFCKLKFDAEYVDIQVMNGNNISNAIAAPDAKLISDKNWVFHVDGMPTTSAQWTKLDALTIKQEITSDHCADENNNGFPDKLAGKLEVSDIGCEFTVDKKTFQEFVRWQENWQRKGSRGELHGEIIYKSPDKRVVATVELGGMGLIEAPWEEVKGGQNKAFKIKPKFYIHEVKYIHLPTSSPVGGARV
jgi:hypothetical protein